MTAWSRTEASAWLSPLFRHYVRGYVVRHFHALRVSRAGRVPDVPAGPMVVVLNHPSWWDPLVALLLSEFWPGRRPYAPVESEALRRYPILERLGLFGIAPGTFSGGRAFLRQGRAILGRPDTALWLTAQGRFADARERPLRLMPGVGHLVHRLGVGTLVPLALEYPFWNERHPEALARFGTVLELTERLTPAAWTERIARALEAAQDALAAEAQARNPAAFVTVLAGTAGVGGVYDLARRVRAALRGERFQAGHSAAPTIHKPLPAGEVR